MRITNATGPTPMMRMVAAISCYDIGYNPVDGRMYYSTMVNQQVFAVWPHNHTIVPVAGGGATPLASGWGQLALSVNLGGGTLGLGVGRDGNVYVALGQQWGLAQSYSYIVRLGLDRRIYLVAGTGSSGTPFLFGGSPATSTQLSNNIYDIAVGSNNELYLTSNAYQIAVITKNGTIWPLIGRNNDAGPSVDGTPVRSAAIYNFYGLMWERAVTSASSDVGLSFLDNLGGSRRIRRISVTAECPLPATPTVTPTASITPSSSATASVTPTATSSVGSQAAVMPPTLNGCLGTLAFANTAAVYGGDGGSALAASYQPVSSLRAYV